MINGNGQSLDSTLSLIALVYISILLSSLRKQFKANMIKFNYEVNLTCSDVYAAMKYCNFNTTLWG